MYISVYDYTNLYTETTNNQCAKCVSSRYLSAHITWK